MTLDIAEVGKVYEVIDLKLHDLAGRRLEALGLNQGTTIELMNQKRSGAVIFKVRGTRLAVGNKIAHAIEVKEAKRGSYSSK